ncbi:MAG TPA: ATP-binding protein, partial [Candidatus Acidoferrales bacterium]|nr:ATP-binding protein [Candidatus Acidoferrales bacterium]
LLEEVGLAAALKWFADGFAGRSNMTLHVDVAHDFGRLSEDAETALFRVAQEALVNAQLHSGSKEASIRVVRDHDQVTLEVTDYGQGMREDGGSAHQVGVGLQSMKERMRQLGGRLELLSTPTGTMVRAILPLRGES